MKLFACRFDVLEYRLNTQPKTIGFVPTMGGLHAGHASLIKEAKKTCDIVIVSVFLNPHQFAPTEDFDQYPHNKSADIQFCKTLNVDALWMPGYDDVFSINASAYTPSKELVNQLCGVSRPHFFSAVCDVVDRLFRITTPTHAFFGDKDLQQRIIIQQMVDDLSLPIQIVSCPIFRESSGLACSSRNENLSAQTRLLAGQLYAIISKAKELYLIRSNDAITKTIEKKCNHIGASIDYITFFTPPNTNSVYCCIAVIMDGVRLIDNIQMA